MNAPRGTIEFLIVKVGLFERNRAKRNETPVARIDLPHDDGRLIVANAVRMPIFHHCHRVHRGHAAMVFGGLAVCMLVMPRIA